ncbi:MAG: hypothetical protein GY774_28300, partial [Planctomycetes bacterium]|nr:hypothetical protein [Planctomycetota bacterium]
SFIMCSSFFLSFSLSQYDDAAVFVLDPGDPFTALRTLVFGPLSISEYEPLTIAAKSILMASNLVFN